MAFGPKIDRQLGILEMKTCLFKQTYILNMLKKIYVLEDLAGYKIRSASHWNRLAGAFSLTGNS